MQLKVGYRPLRIFRWCVYVYYFCSTKNPKLKSISTGVESINVKKTYLAVLILNINSWWPWSVFGPLLKVIFCVFSFTKWGSLCLETFSLRFFLGILFSWRVLSGMALVPRNPLPFPPVIPQPPNSCVCPSTWFPVSGPKAMDVGLMEDVWGTWLIHLLSVLCHGALRLPAEKRDWLEADLAAH